MQRLKVEYVDINSIKEYKNNAKLHPAEQIEQIKKSIEQFGMNDPIGIWKDEIVEGHGRLLALKELDYKEVPIIRLDHMTDEERRAYILAHNKLTMNSDFDIDVLNDELDDILNIDMSDFGFEKEITNDITEDYSEKTPKTLREKFIVPPFSVLDARNGEWQKRKKNWLKIIDSGAGRSDILLGKGLMELANKNGESNLTGTSIFDPVLCEVLINWFSPKGGKIIDPFAGGSVRGLVSSYLHREYYGNDLSKEQIESNKEQFEELKKETDFYGDKLKKPFWSNGDSLKIDEIIKEKDFDLMLTCPPYADLEIYSDDPRDISNMEYDDFIKVYGEIIKKTVDKMKENSFACIVVGEVRDKDGIYRNFIGDTIKKAEEAGLKYYNEIILITMCGTLPLRAGKIFETSRKVGNTHQKALVFYKSKKEEDFKNFIKEFENSRQLAPMKKSVLVFLKGNSKLAKSDIENYDFELF